MKIETALPPNFDQILEAFPNANGPGVLFCYGDTIYNPSGVFVPPVLIAHEEEHSVRQLHGEWTGSDAFKIDMWWRRYIDDPYYRYGQELAAHTAEYRYQRVKDTNRNAQILMSTARRLIAPLYAYPKDFTLNRAMKDIRQLAERS